ncbi:MAG: hypothetical protein V1871_03840 [Planctomycetota bacterium]
MNKADKDELYKMLKQLYELDDRRPLGPINGKLYELNKSKIGDDELFRIKLSLEKVKYKSKLPDSVIESETFAYFSPGFFPNSLFAGMGIDPGEGMKSVPVLPEK